MDNMIRIDKDYVEWLKHVKKRFKNTQIKASIKVNDELLRFYWSIGKDIVNMQAESKWGGAFFETLSEDLKIDLNNLLIVMFMGLIISSFSRVLIGNGAKYISASEVSLLMLIETIMAPIWVWVFLNEIPTIYTFIGGSVIVATLVVNSLYTLKKDISL